MDGIRYRHICGQCDFWLSGVCCNGESWHRADFTTADQGCEEFSPAQPKPALIVKRGENTRVECPRCEGNLAVSPVRTGSGNCPGCGAVYTLPARTWDGIEKEAVLASKCLDGNGQLQKQAKKVSDGKENANT